MSKIANSAIIHDNVIIGMGVEIRDGCIIGGEPENQSNDNRGNYPVIIHKNVFISENVVIHRGINGPTVIDNYCYIMDRCHIGHDGYLEEYVTLSPGVTIGGHSRIMQHATLGIHSATHQYRVVGSYCMIGMGAMVVTDIFPGALAVGVPAKVIGKNNRKLKNIKAALLLKELVRYEALLWTS